MKTIRLLLAPAILACLSALEPHLAAAPLPTAFSFQGRLNDGTGPASGLYDLRFAVYEAATGGSPVSVAVTNAATRVVDGLFAVTLDFGAGVFTGGARWLGVAVRANGGGDDFSVLSPRQPLNPTPYAIHASEAGTATSLAANSVPASALQANAVDSSKIADGSITASDLAGPVLTSTFWRLSGNAGTAPGTHFLGTADGQPLRLQASGVGINTSNPDRPLAIQGLGPSGEWLSFKDTNGVTRWHLNSYLGGVNFVQSGIADARLFLATNGDVGIGTASPQNKLEVAGKVAADGLRLNGNPALGSVMTASDALGTAAWRGLLRVVPTSSGSGLFVRLSANIIGGGPDNVVSNGIAGATISGGGNASSFLGSLPNVVGGSFATVAGGLNNWALGEFSFAAGRGARAQQDGSFVWADSQASLFGSTATDQFLVRAQNGVGVNTTNTADAALTVNGHTHIEDYDIFFRSGADRNHGVGWYPDFAARVVALCSMARRAACWARRGRAVTSGHSPGTPPAKCV